MAPALQAGDAEVRADQLKTLRPVGRPRCRWLRRGLWRRAPRRGEIPRQGTRLFLPRHLRPVGSQKPAPRAVEPVQQPRRQATHPRVSASNWTELDVWEYIDLEKIPIGPCISPETAHGGARRNLDFPSSTHAAAARRTAADGDDRMRSLGCTYCTGAIRSQADTVPRSFRR